MASDAGERLGHELLLDKSNHLEAEQRRFKIFLAIILEARAARVPSFLRLSRLWIDRAALTDPVTAFDLDESHAFGMAKVGAPFAHGMKTKLFI